MTREADLVGTSFENKQPALEHKKGNSLTFFTLKTSFSFSKSVPIPDSDDQLTAFYCCIYDALSFFNCC